MELFETFASHAAVKGMHSFRLQLLDLGAYVQNHEPTVNYCVPKYDAQKRTRVCVLSAKWSHVIMHNAHHVLHNPSGLQVLSKGSSMKCGFYKTWGLSILTLVFGIQNEGPVFGRQQAPRVSESLKAWALPAVGVAAGSGVPCWQPLLLRPPGLLLERACKCARFS